MFSIVYSPKSCLLLHLDAVLCIWFGMEWGLQRLESHKGLSVAYVLAGLLDLVSVLLTIISPVVLFRLPFHTQVFLLFPDFKSLSSFMSSITNWKSSRFRMHSYLPNNSLELHAVWWYSWFLQGYGSVKMVSRNTLTVIRKLYLPGST